jgi:hypothetical protein
VKIEQMPSESAAARSKLPILTTQALRFIVFAGGHGVVSDETAERPGGPGDFPPAGADWEIAPLNCGVGALAKPVIVRGG